MTSQGTTERDTVRGPLDDAASIRTLPLYSVGPQPGDRPPSPTPTYYSVRPPAYDIVQIAEQENSRPQAPIVNAVTKTARLKEVEDRLKLNPDDGFAFMALGHIYSASSVDYDKAIEAYRTAINVGNNLDLFNVARVWKYLGQIYEQKGDIDEALGAYFTAMIIEPNDLVAQRCAGDMYKMKKDYVRAVAAYELVLAKKPTDEIALSSLARTYKEMGSYTKAIDAYETLTRSHLDDFEAWKTLVELYTRQKGFSDTWVNERTLDPTDLWQQIRLAEIFYKGKNYSKAIEIYETAKQSNLLPPGALWMHKRLGEVYEAKGEVELAAREYVRVLTAGRYDGRLADHLAELDKESFWKDNDCSIEIYERILAVRPEYHSIRKCLAEAYETKGNDEKAIKAYECLLNVNPTDLWAYGQLGAMYEKIGEINKAIKMYEALFEKRPMNMVSLRLHLERLYKTRSTS